MPRCSGCCFDSSWLSSSAYRVVAHRLQQLLGGLESLVLPRGGKGGSSLSTAPRGLRGAWFGSGQASSPSKGVQCCPRTVSEAAGTRCQDCALRHHRHPGLSPVLQSVIAPFSRPLAQAQQCPCCLQALQAVPVSQPNPPPCPAPGICHHAPHSKQRPGRSSCSRERWGYLQTLPIPT